MQANFTTAVAHFIACDKPYPEPAQLFLDDTSTHGPLVDFILDRGYTPRELAAAVKVHEFEIDRFKQGKQDMTYNQLQSALHALFCVYQWYKQAQPEGTIPEFLAS